MNRRFSRMLAAIVLFAIAVRLAIRAALGTQAYWQDGYGLYARLAVQLSGGRGYAFAGGPPTAYRVPLYPLFVAATSGGTNAWGLIAAQALVSGLTVGLTGMIARHLAGDRAGLLAALVLALWPYSAWHDLSLQETGLFACLSALATLLAMQAPRSRRAALAAGLAMGLAMLTRATLLPWAALAIGWIGWRAGLRKAALALAALLLTLSPWLAWSWQVTGNPVLGTESGAQLYAGNHALTFTAYPARSIDESRAVIFAAHTPAEKSQLAALRADPLATDRWYRSRALAEIAAHPGRFLHGAARKLWAAFGPWPSPRHGFRADLAYAAGWLPFAGLAAAGLWLRRRHWRDDLPATLHLPAFMLTSALFWAQTAHRSAIDFALAVFAGIALSHLLPRMAAWGKGAPSNPRTLERT
ncbi:MAG: glycosyltransferase family 39 protein [Novosphingobium sp.]